MKKIISVFQRNYDTDHLIRDEVVPGAEWVLAGEGVATRKWDGTPILVMGGLLYRRYDCKKGCMPPSGFEPTQEPDEKTGHWPGWVPADLLAKENLPILEAAGLNSGFSWPPNGTYELCGPKVNRNPEGFATHVLLRHGEATLDVRNAPRDFNGLRAWFEPRDIEGIVYHHPDGRMAKVKKKDYGLPRQPEA